MNYEKLAKTAIRLINGTGRVATLQRLSAEAVDEDRPWLGPGEPEVVEEVEVVATFVPSGSGGMGLEFVDEELLKRAEQVALIAPIQEGLQAFHTLLDGGVRWKLEWVQVLRPAEKTLLYVAGVAR